MGVRNMSACIRKMCIDGYIVQLQIPELTECVFVVHIQYKLGATVAKRNEKLIKLLNGIAQMNLGDVKNHDIYSFGDACEYLSCARIISG